MLINILILKVSSKSASFWKNFIDHFNLLTWDRVLWVWLLFIFDGQVPQGVVGK